MSLTEIRGDLFAVPGLDALAHGVNCAGKMGAGIAVEFKRRWPAMFTAYRVACLEGRLVPGTVFAERADGRWIYNLATQDKPGSRARLEWVQATLGAMAARARWQHGVRRIGMPRIGCGLGGLSWDDVRPLVERTAKDVDIVVVEWAKEARRG